MLTEACCILRFIPKQFYPDRRVRHMTACAIKTLPFPVRILAARQFMAPGRGSEHDMGFLVDALMALPAKQVSFFQKECIIRAGVWDVAAQA
jgi:hypothetical protein